MITYNYDLDLVPGRVPLTIHVSQYDSGSRAIVFSLFSSTGEFVIPAEATAEVKGTKPDGNGFSYEAELSGNTVTINVTKQMTAMAGKAICEIVILHGETELATANFILYIERAALDKDTLISGSEIRELVDIMDNSAEIIAAAHEAAAAQEMVTASKEAAERAANNAADSRDAAAQKVTEAENALAEVRRKAAEIASIKTDADTIAAQALEKASNAENEVAENQNTIDGLKQKDNAMQLAIEGKIDGAYVENGYLYLTSNDEIVAGPLGPFSGEGGGGGGGGGNNASITVTNVTGWLSKTIAYKDSCTIKINWSSTEDDLPTGNGTMKITVNGVVKALLDIAQGEVTAELTSYLAVGSNVVKVNVADVYGNNRTINFSISTVDLSLSSSFDASVPYTGPFTFPFVPVGSVQKTIHFIMDGKQIGSMQTSVSGRQQSFTVKQQTHGAHTFQCYFEAEINGQTVRSNELYYEIICLETLNDTPIIVSSFHETEEKQYTTIHIGYTVYDPTDLTADVSIYVNDNLVSEQTVDRTTQVFSYRADAVGELKIDIVSGEISKSFRLTITESDIDVEAETDSLALYLSSHGRSNNEATRHVWNYQQIQADLSGFNFTSDGWQQDEDGTTVLRVAGDARVTVPYQIFASDCRQTGKTIELEFATRDVMNYDTVILSCMADGKGISLTAQKIRLTSEQSEISMQFKEEEHVRAAFVIEKRSEHRLIYCYINGIMSGVVQYPEDDDFAQTTPVNITIGSNDCTVDLYCIRVYDNDLTRHQILDNWIADTQTIEDMLSRYQRNSVYDEYGNIVIAQLPGDLPYMILECAELPQYKGDKKTVSGSFVDPVNASRSFTFEHAQFDVQGTSSQYYKRKNYKAKFKGGFVMNNGSSAETYAIRAGVIPTDTFCFKADVASSEGANNVELARLYNDACPYRTPAQSDDERIRQGIDGFPMVVFWNNGTETIFLGKYNFNLDKGTEEVFGFAGEDESWEVRNNTSDRVLWKSDDYTGDDWLNDFEARYPEDYADPAQLAEFASWIVKTDTTKPTGQFIEAVTYDGVEYTRDTAEYRLAKFKAELPSMCEMNSAVFYYLFTELFLMVDSRAKNMFPSFIGGSV